MPSRIDAATASFFRNLSALRGKRIFHPDGVGFAATFTPRTDGASGARLLDEGPRDAIVRLSRAVGLPEPLPDALGLAVRVSDAYGSGRHQDFLLVTSSGRSVGRHLILPASGFSARDYSSLLPYHVAGKLVIVGAKPSSGPAGHRTLADLRHQGAAPLTFQLMLAQPLGSWHEVARLELGERLPDSESEQLRFDPSNTGGGIELAGFLNRLRRPAYRGSQEGRSARGSRAMRPAAAPGARHRPRARTGQGAPRR